MASANCEHFTIIEKVTRSGLTPVDKWLTWCLDSNIVVGIDADVIPLEREGILAAVNSLQLVVVLEVGPAPQTAVNHMRKSLAMRNLMRREREKESS